MMNNDQEVTLQDIRKAPWHWSSIICEKQEPDSLFFRYGPIALFVDQSDPIRNPSYFGMDVTRIVRIIAQIVHLCKVSLTPRAKMQSIAWIHGNTKNELIREICDDILSHMKAYRMSLPAEESVMTGTGPIEEYYTTMRKPNLSQVLLANEKEPISERKLIKDQLLSILTSKWVFPLMMDCYDIYTGANSDYPYSNTVTETEIIANMVYVSDQSITEIYFLLSHLYKKIETGKSTTPLEYFIKIMDKINKMIKGEEIDISELVSQLIKIS